ncbi:DUF4427 domain-containing protein [Aureimonas sp. AU22]|uniref:DUF4427 domain-containing protein n=1 Tax=Aureimonas sp. AU22 TaxID=1638162 RepID=UPI00178CEDBE|nr:DUF4427 domain-containing protein [Aureimonas sp. AU22]
MTFYPDDWGPGAITEDDHVPPFFLLRNAIRLNRLWATWSQRKGKRTIHGPDPAVCFTDMPIAAFIEAGEARAAKDEAMSPIALVLPKAELLAAGAIPAIYGRSGTRSGPRTGRDGRRTFPEAELPPIEQFRYVTLSADGRIDWTHEREWRWPFRGTFPEQDGIPSPDGRALPGLDLEFEGKGVIVQSRSQAERVRHDILVQHDRGTRGSYRFVIVRDDIPSMTHLREPDGVQEALRAAAMDLSDLLSMQRSRRNRLISAFGQAIDGVDATRLPNTGRQDGGCWLWLTDIAHEMTRALVSGNMVHVDQEGRYLIDTQIGRRLSLARREELTRRLADVLLERHELRATYHSVQGSCDPDAMPNYSKPPLHDRKIYNYATDG